MIVKIQLSIESSDGKRRMLIYNRDRSIQIEMEAAPTIVAVMGERPKAYFAAQIVDDVLDIGAEVGAQSW